MADSSSFLLNDQYDITNSQHVGLLPIRGEKRLVPIYPQPNTPSSDQVGTSNNNSINAPSKAFQYEAISYAKKTLTDYVTIRLPNRFKSYQTSGFNPTSTGPGEAQMEISASVDSDFIYRFLINPKSISISHQTSDTHALARGGWQFGVWGEDTIDISIIGVTAGQYFDPGLTDRWSEYSISYRNLMELMNVFENNGYYFEGEPPVPTVYDANYTRKRIKLHQDIELRTGNFIWKGMFTNMTVEMMADNPFLVKYNMGFLAWKESYASSSPWISPKDSNIYRGHAKEIIKYPNSTSSSSNNSNSVSNDVTDDSDSSVIQNLPPLTDAFGNPFGTNPSS